MKQRFFYFLQYCAFWLTALKRNVLNDTFKMSNSRSSIMWSNYQINDYSSLYLLRITVTLAIIFQSRISSDCDPFESVIMFSKSSKLHEVCGTNCNSCRVVENNTSNFFTMTGLYTFWLINLQIIKVLL